MNLEGIINISGKPGLYKVISKGKNTLVVESIINGRKNALNPNDQSNMLEEIGIYTYDDTESLSNIFNKIAEKENCEKAISHKSSKSDLTNYFREILTNYDEKRVYISDIKKVIQWYNTMQSSGLIELLKKEETTKKKKI